MGIKSNRVVETYFNYFATSGLDAVNDPVVVVPAWTGARYVSFGGSVPGAITNIMDM